MTDLATVADAIVSEINSASASDTFNRRFEANVLWAKRQIKLSDKLADQLRVDVAPINQSRRLISRGVHLQIFRYDVGVRKRFVESEESSGEIADDEVKELVILLDGLVNFLMPMQPNKTGRPLSAIPNAFVMGPQAGEKDHLAVDSVILWEDMETTRQFTGYFALTIHVPQSADG